MTTFTEGLYAYFRACPLLDKGNRLNWSYRGATPTEYVIDQMPASGPAKRYLSGSAVKEKLFTFGSVESYGEDARIQIANSGFYERLEAWIEAQNENKLFPKTPEGTHPIRLECLTDGYLFTSGENTAQYQIQLRLTYLQGGKRI